MDEQFIERAERISIHDPYSDTHKEITLWRNTTAQQLKNLVSKHGHLRGFEHIGGKDHMYWNANDATHDDIARASSINVQDGQYDHVHLYDATDVEHHVGKRSKRK